MALGTAEFERLLQANRILSSKLDVDEVLLAVLKLATEVVRAEASSILLLDEKTNDLYFDVAIGSAKETVKQIRLKVGEGIAGWVAKENKPLIVNDVSQDPRFTARVDKSTSFKTKSILAVPMSNKGRLIGVVEAINKENNGEFLAQDLEVFDAFASQSAVAIENARLFSAVKLEKEKLNTVFAHMKDGVLLLDENATTVIMNEAGTRFLGHTPADVFGKKFGKELFSNFEKYPTESDLKRMEGDTAVFELDRREIKDLFLMAVVHRLSSDEKSKSRGYLMVLHDVTDEKREERLKRNFLALISHKLRTPLTVIVGYSPMILSSTAGLRDFQIKALKSISEQAGYLAGLVDKLLRFSVLESDDVIKKNDAVKVDELINEALEYFQELSKEKAATFEREGNSSGISPVPMDRGMGLEVLKNLIENGIKFNEQEKKIIRIFSRLENDFAVISIADNGIGIPPEEGEKIFQKFYQIENSFTGQVPGAGLGLPFCRKVMEAMGGKISFESQIGKGSVFSLFFPLK